MVNRYILVLTDTVFSIIEFLLGLRILLKLLGAATSAPFVRWVYETTQPLLAPFEGMFPSTPVPGGFILEASALFALLAYAFVGFLLQSIIIRLTPSRHVHVEETVVTKKRK